MLYTQRTTFFFFNRNFVYKLFYKHICLFNVPHTCCLHGCVMDVIFLMCIYKEFKICPEILIWHENDSMQLKSEMKYSKNIVGCNCSYYQQKMTCLRYGLSIIS